MTPPNKRNNKPQSVVKKPRIIASSTGVNWAGAKTSVKQEDLFQEPTSIINNSGSLLGKDWIHFFDNQYSFLKGLMASIIYSPTLHRIILDKATLANGKGYIPLIQKFSTFLHTKANQTQEAVLSDAQMEFLDNNMRKCNSLGESLHTVLYKVFYDYFGYGNAGVELVCKTKSDGTKELHMFHHPLYTIALHKKDVATNIISGVAIREDWGIFNGKLTEYIPMYPEWGKDATDTTIERTFIHIKNYISGYFYWGMPNWIAARLSAEMEYRIPKYNISKMKNGYVPSSIVQFFGEISDEEAAETIKKFTDKFTDTNNNSKIFAQVVSDERLKANVQVLEDKSEGNYLALQQVSAQNIVTGNQWSMSLAGYAVAGKLGSNEQMKLEIEYARNTGVTPPQLKIENEVLGIYIKELLALGTVKMPDNLILTIAQLNPLSLSSDVIISDVLTTNEQREVIGYAPTTEIPAKVANPTAQITTIPNG